MLQEAFEVHHFVRVLPDRGSRCRAAAYHRRWPYLGEFQRPAGTRCLRSQGLPAHRPRLSLQQTPGPDRVVVQQQNPGDRRVAHAVIQQNQRIRTARQPIGRQTIPRRLAKPNRILTESG